MLQSTNASQHSELVRACSEKTAILIANYPIKPYIPRIWRNFLDFLTLKRNAEQFRSNPVFAVSQKRKATIVIAAAHADAMSVFIECDGRCNDQIAVVEVRSEPRDRVPIRRMSSARVRFRIDFAKNISPLLRKIGTKMRLFARHARSMMFACLLRRSSAGSTRRLCCVKLSRSITRLQIICEALRAVRLVILRRACNACVEVHSLHQVLIATRKGGASRLCRHKPSLSNRSNRWGQPWL